MASPSDLTAYGRSVLAETPDTPGSLGIAISEAVEDAAGRDDTRYSLGSVLNHVLLHQTVIGQEAMEQMALAGEQARHPHRLHGRWLQLRGPDLPVHRPEAAWRGRRTGSSPPSRRLRPA